MKIKELSEPFPPENISWRVQGTPYERNGTYNAMALAYIDARDVMDKLDEVCGPENWQDEYEVTSSGLILCKIGIRIGDDWVWKSDGAGETAIESKKGGVSDSFKRAAVHWGIGRYLYRLSSPWVKCDVKVKGTKVYWKSWAEDPWSKVANAPYTVTNDKNSEQIKGAAIKQAINAIKRETGLEGLQEYFTNLYKTDKETASDPEVIKAKDVRKEELTKQKEAA